MRPPTPPQLDLFPDGRPEATQAPKLALPFQRTSEIDVDRAARILNVSTMTMRRMLEQKLIRAYRIDKGLSPWRIEYESVVDYCDQLILHYGISDTRRKPPASGRRRDDELLPFSKEETIGIADVQKQLDCTGDTVLNLIQSGSLVAYQILTDAKGSPWRIHAPSLERYLGSLHQMATLATSSRRSPSTR
jgi:excisionase family DNA binding protein